MTVSFKKAKALVQLSKAPVAPRASLLPEERRLHLFRIRARSRAWAQISRASLLIWLEGLKCAGIRTAARAPVGPGPRAGGREGELPTNSPNRRLRPHGEKVVPAPGRLEVFPYGYALKT